MKSLSNPQIINGIAESCVAWLNYRKIIGHDIRTPESFISIPISDYLTSLRGVNEANLDFEHSFNFSESSSGLVDLKVDFNQLGRSIFFEFKKLRDDKSYRYDSERHRIIDDLTRLAFIDRSNSSAESKCYFLLFGAPDEFVDFAFYHQGNYAPFIERPSLSGPYHKYLSLNSDEPERCFEADSVNVVTKLLEIKNIEYTVIAPEKLRRRLANPPYLVAVWEVSSSR